MTHLIAILQTDLDYKTPAALLVLSAFIGYIAIRLYQSLRYLEQVPPNHIAVPTDLTQEPILAGRYYNPKQARLIDLSPIILTTASLIITYQPDPKNIRTYQKKSVDDVFSKTHRSIPNTIASLLQTNPNVDLYRYAKDLGIVILNIERAATQTPPGTIILGAGAASDQTQ